LSTPAPPSHRRGDEGGILIVPATAADAEAAAEITREAFDGVSVDQAAEKLLGPVAGLTWQDVKAHQVREEIKQSPEDCFVAKIGQTVVGYVTTRRDEALLRGRIPNLAVHKDFRGRGIGRQLLDRALEHFRRAGLKQARIETLVTNPVGRHLYPAMGFKEVARQIHYAMEL